MSYKYLSLEERHYIAMERKKGLSQKEIASSLNRSASTLSRELFRNMSQRGYRHVYANNKAITRHTDKPSAALPTPTKQVNHPGYKTAICIPCKSRTVSFNRFCSSILIVFVIIIKHLKLLGDKRNRLGDLFFRNPKALISQLGALHTLAACAAYI